MKPVFFTALCAVTMLHNHVVGCDDFNMMFTELISVFWSFFSLVVTSLLNTEGSTATEPLFSNMTSLVSFPMDMPKNKTIFDPIVLIFSNKAYFSFWLNSGSTKKWMQL